jgi:cyclohexyl-isocyanide hydratase
MAQSIQLMIEYDPQPPYQAGSPRTAPPDMVQRMRLQSRHAAAERAAG